ncbi:MAG TPA: hypothetical protein VGH38_36500, partial [Bryobacteraceae bacterium]
MRIWHVAAMIAAVVVISVPEGLDSCGIALPTAVFATTQGPADLKDQFLKGKLGVLRRSYRQQYLIGAFRILSGVPLTEPEVKSLYSAPGVNTNFSLGWISPSPWTGARGAANAPKVDAYKTVSLNGLIYSLANCQQDAFFKAGETLTGLKSTWGDQDPRTLEWIRAQDQVFANCSGKEAVIPEPPSAGMDPLLAAHRRYQIAAAYFYSGQYR